MTTTIEGLGFFGVDSVRSRAYLHRMVELGFRPASAILIPTRGGPARARAVTPVEQFDNVTPLPDALDRAGVPWSTAASGDINDASVISRVAAAGVEHMIFSGPPGGIAGEALLSCGPGMIHAHSGWLPDYRGSTTTYYQILAEGRVGVSVLLLRPRIDEGPVLARRWYPLPDDLTTVDIQWDPWLRANLLGEVIASYATDGVLDEAPQEAATGGAFYIIHPVLKHIAVLGDHHQELQT